MATATAISPFAPGLRLTVDPAWHLARRATYAATAAQAAAIRRVGTTRWIDAQLQPARIDDRACERFVAATFPVTRLDVPSIRRFTDDKPWEAQPSLARATVWRQLTTRRPLLEKTVELWHDHLHIALNSDKVHGWVCTYDREVIRPRAFGRFADLLYAAITHPAMLLYLDNAWSTKAHPVENLAREFLELHTVGTAAYTERDVAQLALLLTGFSVDEEAGRFMYRPQQHHVGPLRIVGVTVPNASAGAGPAALRALVERLAVHPATVRRVVTRLAVRFVADRPPPALIRRLSQVYVAHHTSIGPVLRALLTSPEFAASAGQKWSRPQEFLASIHAAGAPRYVAPGRPESWAPLGTYVWLLETLGHVPLEHPDPDGPKDVASAWLHPAALLTRWNAAEACAGRWDKTLALRPWATVCGLTTTMTCARAATLLFTQLTGFAPAAADRDAVAAFLHDPSGRSRPSARTKVSADGLRWHVDGAVRLVFASPYASLR